jgi:hypothetical protein
MGIVKVSIRRLKKQLEDWGGEYGDVAAAPAVFGSDEGAASWLKLSMHLRASI